jgi:hypothetical protein
LISPFLRRAAVPFLSFAAKLYKHAAEPASPLSPFSTASSPTRAAAIALYAEVIEGARIRVPAGLRSRLPELLWLYSLGIVLYWVHDTSPGCAKTYRLIDLTTPLAERLIRLARLPVLRSLTRRLLSVLDEFSPKACPGAVREHHPAHQSQLSRSSRASPISTSGNDMHVAWVWLFQSERGGPVPGPPRPGRAADGPGPPRCDAAGVATPAASHRGR